MEEKKVRVSWIKSGNEYQRVEGECDNVETLPPGIYTVHLSDKKGWWLEFYREKFTFDYKLYGCDEGFVDYFMKTYESTKGNIGVMFNGIKGTGKTVTAKVLANKLNVPIIIVKGMDDLNAALMEYLSSFNFDCVYFFDEFEKNFKDDDASVLQIMDGVYNSEYRKVFLLTTNRTWVNENLLSRPSRIRYIKEFKNISRELIDEYMKDNLNDMSAKEDIITYIDTLDVSTIDILKTAVQEVNIHGKEAFRKNMKVLNADLMSIRYMCYFLPAGKSWKLSVDDFLTVVNEFEKQFDSRGFEKKYSETNDFDLPDEIHEAKPYATPVKKPAASEFDSILPSTGYTQSDKLSDVTINDLCNSVRRGWRVESDIPLSKLNVGDDWYNEKIVFVDFNKAVVVTDNEGCINYYYVTNPDEKKSNYFEGNYSKYSFLY
jgi:broad-specificity NMP kinase